jgi:peptidoglycan/xylan/chitin deacetylase (PgdA/CDA1 family)
MLAFVLRWRARLSSSRAGVVLVYHRVGGPTSGNQDVEILPAVGRAAFEEQLRQLKRHYRVVPAKEILDAVNSRRRGERFPVAVTFDDDLPEHVWDALPALRAAGLTATFFLNGASLDGPHSFWWEDLQRAVDGKLITKLPYVDPRDALARRPRAILDLSGAITRLTPEQRSQIATALRDAVGAPPDGSGLHASQVRTLVESGSTIGFHTLRHDVLPSLDDAALDRALEDGRAELEAASGRQLDTIGYPYGKADDRVAQAARAAGFSAGFTTARGVVRPETNPLLIPRTVPDLTAPGLARRLARLFADA